jgi:hypothetical protein
MANPRLNEAGLRRLAEASGGRYGTAEQGAAAAGWALEAARAAASPPEWRDAWHTGWMFLAIVTAMAIEWALRRRWGLR